jgi:hypothetical protein
MSVVTASKLNLLEKCGYWARADVERVNTEAGASARDGTALHALCDAYVRGSAVDLQALECADPDRVRRAWLHVQAWLDAHP